MPDRINFAPVQLPYFWKGDKLSCSHTQTPYHYDTNHAHKLNHKGNSTKQYQRTQISYLFGQKHQYNLHNLGFTIAYWHKQICLPRPLFNKRSIKGRSDRHDSWRVCTDSISNTYYFVRNLSAPSKTCYNEKIEPISMCIVKWGQTNQCKCGWHEELADPYNKNTLKNKEIENCLDNCIVLIVL
jgi:hypothetical protein